MQGSSRRFLNPAPRPPRGIPVLLLALSACLQPQLRGEPVADFVIREGGDQVGRAWLFEGPQAERVIWNTERAWEVSAEPTDTFRIRARSGEDIQRGRYRLDQLPWDDGPLLRYQAPLLDQTPRGAPVEGVEVYDLPSTLVLHDERGLAAVYWPGTQLLREDRLPTGSNPLPRIPVQGVQRAPLSSPQGSVGSLHGPIGQTGLPGVVIDSETSAPTDADFLAQQGWLILRSPGADPAPFAGLSLPCAPVVLTQPAPSADAVRAALSTHGCPSPLAPPDGE